MSLLQNGLEKDFPDEVTPEAMSFPAARGMARLLASGIYAGGRLVSCRRTRGRPETSEAVVVDVEVALGQRPKVNDIRPVERVAIGYTGDDRLPTVIPLRDDFPQEVPHLNVSRRDEPRTLCLFDMQPEEAVRLATPLVLVERVRFWMAETAYGRLHGEEQPLDPVFFGALVQIVLPRGMDERTDMLAAYRASGLRDAPWLLRAAKAGVPADTTSMSVLSIRTRPLAHGRMGLVPINVAELVETYADHGLELAPEIRTALLTWVRESLWRRLKDEHCLVLLETPIEREPGRTGRVATKAFLTTCKAVELGRAMGVVEEVDGHPGVLVGQPPDMAALRRIGLLPMDVHRPFGRPAALAASGLADGPEATRAITLAGAGALGSQVAMTAARMGLGTWGVVDADYLLPHNMARHALSHRHIGRPKAESLAEEIQGLLGPDAATAAVCRIEDAEASSVLSAAFMVLDASASVPAARWLGGVSKHLGRTCSVFLNPAGTDLVLLVEGEGRMPRLDHVEMSYYWALALGEGPAGHLSNGGVGLYPSGGCRRASLAISQADVGALAPVAVKRLLQFPLPDHGLVEIAGNGADGSAVFSVTAVAYEETRLSGWTVAVSSDVLRGIVADRDRAGSDETGGILVGTWDRSRRRAYVVGRFTAPPDSVAGPDCYVRGAEGVFRTLESVERMTAGNLTYVGEWHTHPAGHGSSPSADDGALLRWIGEALAFSDVPALMIIAGSDGLRIMLNPDKASQFIASTVTKVEL